MIRFRRLKVIPRIVEGIRIERWEIAQDENELWYKLDGDMAHIIIPSEPWYIRLCRMVFPLSGIEVEMEKTYETTFNHQGKICNHKEIHSTK